jgi:hypothetical protein
MPGIEELVNQIKTGDVKYIIGIEKDGVRHYIKSDFSASIIGYFYRNSLKNEKPEELPSKVLPFPEFGEGDSLKVKRPKKKAGELLLFPNVQEKRQR